jgi:hypothetical protein
MNEQQSTPRVSDDATAEKGAELRVRSAAVPATRLLANPRRVRRA